MPREQPDLFNHVFTTAEPANPLFCHQDFLEKLEACRNHPAGKRAALLMQRLAVDERRQHYKSTQGANQGWRRSRLGGHGGNQFYAWWAPRGASPMKAGTDFGEAPAGSIFLRDIRHHDDHSPAPAHSFLEHYLPVSIPELRGEEYGPAPWTVPQARFAVARQRVRILKGFPGSGKTTALMHAADSCGAGRVLYATYSPELAGLARRHFDRFCSRDREFHAVTFEALLRQLLRCDAPAANTAELQRRFRGDLVPFARSLGPWADRAVALYDEMHAHLAGAALPVAVGRFAAAPGPRAADKNYRERRTRYLGDYAVSAVLDTAARLERSDPRSLAERHFPELALAWRAAALLAAKGSPKVPPEFLEFDCIAVDECQDLTPLEAFVIVELAAAAGRHQGRPVSLLLAGDEAQTVRPTDFEWGWMNDLLHHRAGTPAEFQLGTNLRSPRRIAMLVNRVWDLYAELGKRDRPSGTGYAEIEDDATDQVFFCTAAPGAELEALLTELASREGLAMVAFEPAAREAVPEAVRAAVLSPGEVKGLDFHTVCLLNGGRQLQTIFDSGSNRFATADIESIRRRLAIDELRVALSRPADRLIWLDIAPSADSVRTTLNFLNTDPFTAVSPSIPAAVLKALEEEQLDLEERVQRCQADARQFLGVRPEIAWSRARQAVTLLGDADGAASVQDPAARGAAWLTAAEISFCLGFRDVRLPPELGRPDLFREAATSARMAGRPGLSEILERAGAVARSFDAAARLNALCELAAAMVRHRAGIEPWVLAEMAGKSAAWLDEMEGALTANTATVARVLPPFYDVLRVPGAEARKARVLDRAVRLLMKNRRHEEALAILEGLPERVPALEAECLEGMGEFARAAEAHRALGKMKEALACYRSVPDFDAAAALIRELADHPAAEAYRWLEKMRAAVAERPANFNRVMQPAEKKLLEQMLEEALGVARKKPVPRKAAPKGPGAKVKRAPARAPRKRLGE